LENRSDNKGGIGAANEDKSGKGEDPERLVREDAEI
jgi:hypothetical protein